MATAGEPGIVNTAPGSRLFRMDGISPLEKAAYVSLTIRTCESCCIGCPPCKHLCSQECCPFRVEPLSVWSIPAPSRVPPLSVGRPGTERSPRCAGWRHPSDRRGGATAGRHTREPGRLGRRHYRARCGLAATCTPESECREWRRFVPAGGGKNRSSTGGRPFSRDPLRE